MSITLHISPRIIPSIATLYTDITRIILEYIDNSLDSAEFFYDRANNRYTKSIEIIVVIDGGRLRNGRVVVYDNCFGIANLPKVVNSIGNSDKKAQAWTNGQFGYGIYSFMACCKNLEITTKLENDAPYYIPINRDQFDTDHQEDVIFPDPELKHSLTLRKEEELLFSSSSKRANFESISGTKIILSKFNRNSWEELDVKLLKLEVEKHFEFLLSRKNLTIKLVRGQQSYVCEPFDYNQYTGETYQNEIDQLITTHYSTKHTFSLIPPIKIFLKVTKGQEINKRPIFVSKGRRIAEIKSVKSFKSRNKSKLWDHPNVTGFVDLGNFLGPTIARTDFKNDIKSKAFFNALIDLEPLILDVVKDVNQALQERHYRQLEDRLNKVLSKLAKLDRINFRTDYLQGGTVNLTAGSSGSAAEDGQGSDVPIPMGTGSKPTSTEGVGVDNGNGTGTTESPGSIPGPEDGGPSPVNKEPDNPFQDSEFKARERKRSGFNIRLVDRDPDVNEETSQPIRSQINADEIIIFKQHPDFEARVDTSRRGKQKITQRLITYLAGEITVHYKDTFHNKVGQREYNKTMFIGLMDFVYQFENALSDLAGMNLSDFNDE